MNNRVSCCMFILHEQEISHSFVYLSSTPHQKLMTRDPARNPLLITALIRSFIVMSSSDLIVFSTIHSLFLMHRVFSASQCWMCLTYFQFKCFTDHKSQYFTELIFPEKQNSFSISHINQSFDFAFLHTITDYQYQ